MSRITKNLWIKEVLTLLVLLVFIYGYKSLEPFLKAVVGIDKDSVEWAPLYTLAGEYLRVVILSSLISLLIAIIIASIVHLLQWGSLKDLCLALGSFGTTFPTIAVIALLVPSLGYGFKPVFVGLVLYGVFPILNSAVKGFEQIDPAIIEAGEGMGMNDLQRFLKIELPLAIPTIMAGVKTSVIINIAATTVGAVVGAGGLGMPIVSGIRTNNPVLMLKGAIPVALIALLTNQLFKRLEDGLEWRSL